MPPRQSLRARVAPLPYHRTFILPRRTNPICRCHHMRCFTGCPGAALNPPSPGFTAPPLCLNVLQPAREQPQLSQSLRHMGPARGRHSIFDNTARCEQLSQQRAKNLNNSCTAENRVKSEKDPGQLFRSHDLVNRTSCGGAPSASCFAGYDRWLPLTCRGTCLTRSAL